jgi:hypothetical protein
MLHTSFLYFNPRPFAILKEDYAARIESGSVPVQYYYHAAYVRETNNEASALLATLNDWFDSNSACVAVYYWLRLELMELDNSSSTYLLILCGLTTRQICLTST